MRLRVVLLLILPFVFCAAQQKQGGNERKPAKTEAKSPSEPGLPAGAKEFEPGTWRYTDPQGKTWIYRRTPFGLMKGEEHQGSDDLPPGMIASEDGDTIRFERPSPFGHLKWTKKKTDELNEVERRVWERDRGKKAEAAKAKPAEKAPAPPERKPDAKE